MKQMPDLLDWGDALLGLVVTAIALARRSARPEELQFTFVANDNRLLVRVALKPTWPILRRLFGSAERAVRLTYRIEPTDGRTKNGRVLSIPETPADFWDASDLVNYGSVAVVSQHDPVMFSARGIKRTGTYKVTFTTGGKSLVREFVCLADDGDCQWATPGVTYLK